MQVKIFNYFEFRFHLIVLLKIPISICGLNAKIVELNYKKN